MSDELALRPDGRQSETALMIARGVRRLLRARGFSSLTELSLIDGRRADIVAVNAEGEVLQGNRISKQGQEPGKVGLVPTGSFEFSPQ